ncbi:MAG: hypothetical protein JWN66_2550 [Sphingomonas bacterium]|uniref:PilZ domain-containing protein n=1 Tax=Sphingomonas bacterium TaxID=1895847 RepID=UPI00262A01D8|nr:PilZ domain-containing protein [Sphingomonas bacterium]MDB5705434.1 hypothetical protein [Sphingomonas bacterium]
MLDHYDDGELTTISFSISPPSPPDRRHEARQVTVLRVAKLQTPRSEELCLVRNISGGGLMAHIYSELNVGDPVTAEFKSGHAVSGRVLWRRDGLAGIQFNAPVNAVEVLADKVDFSPTALQPRAPRVGLEVRGRIRVGARYHAVTLSNISQSGARIQPGEVVEVGQKLVLMVAGLPPIAGSIRWRDSERAGIHFDTPIPFDILARWVPIVQEQARERRLGSPPDDGAA